MSAYAIYAKDVDGSPVIPPSQRPDGTWRKQRRVKEGYVPQEEVPLYESKGKQFAKSKPQHIPGLPPPVINTTPNLNLPITKRCPIPGLVVDEDYMKKIKNKKKPSSNVGNNNASNNKTEKEKEKEKANKLADKLSQVTIKESSNQTSDPAKRLKNLKKKLREIDTIEQKIKSGEIKNPIKEQLEKVSRRKEVMAEIQKLEKLVTK
ncbi:partner of Y14 and mago [Chrysoperla carnea]|uniref:partner of Y14 and mago n=1 Tax=Chrysoperla carnea TaxID=189513 RepID=UPI001D07E954|nr:partner of Y14 and mago [Chrysoperla carnea]